MPTIAVTIVSWNSADTLPAMLASVGELSPPPDEVVAVDNASSDDSLQILRASPVVTKVIPMEDNTGFSGGQNAALGATTSELVACLNPDLLVTPDFLKEASAPFEDPTVGMVSGKLLRTTDEFGIPDADPLLDSTGIVFTRNGRHLDRGADQPDRGQYDRAEEVFGPSGAAAVYRRRMLDEVTVEGEVFDTDFHSYREDADLAWRARLSGWRGWYTPAAVAHHRRRVTPERRSELPAAINYHSVKNRFLMRIKNEGMGLLLRNGPRELIRDLGVVGWVLLREPTSRGALTEVVRLLPRTLHKRRIIQSRRKVSDRELAPWFGRT